MTVAPVDFHPAVLQPELDRMRRRLLWMAAAGALWALCVFLISLRPPGFLRPYSSPIFNAGVFYSWYCCLHSFYIALGVLLSRLLVSRGWLRAAALGCWIPGPGPLFNLPLVLPAVLIFRRLGSEDFENFFEWKAKTSSLNPAKDLTADSPRKILQQRIEGQ